MIVLLVVVTAAVVVVRPGSGEQRASPDEIPDRHCELAHRALADGDLQTARDRWTQAVAVEGATNFASVAELLKAIVAAELAADDERRWNAFASLLPSGSLDAAAKILGQLCELGPRLEGRPLGGRRRLCGPVDRIGP